MTTKPKPDDSAAETFFFVCMLFVTVVLVAIGWFKGVDHGKDVLCRTYEGRMIDNKCIRRDSLKEVRP